MNSRPMSNIDKQSLRQTAEKAQEHGVFNMDIHSQTVLALLDELEAKDKRIVDLEARTLVPVEPTLDQLVAGKRRLTSTGRMSRLMSQRLAEVYRAMVNAAAAGKGE